MRRLLIRLLVVAGVASLAAGVLMFNGPRMRRQPYVRTGARHMALPPEGVAFVAASDHGAAVPAAAAGAAATKPAGAAARDGAVVYGYYCAFCHGPRGDGGGPVGESFLPPPADLRSERVARMSDAELRRATFTGVGHAPVLERVVPDAFRDDLVAYVRLFATGTNAEMSQVIRRADLATGPMAPSMSSTYYGGNETDSRARGRPATKE